MALTGLKQLFQDAVTETSSTPLHPIGFIRYEDDGATNGVKKYMYAQADDAFTQYQAAALDLAASATCQKVTPSSAAGQMVIGAAQVAVTDEYYFWLQTGGLMSVNMKTGVTAAGDPLTGTATAGAVGLASESGSGSYKHVAGLAATTNTSGGDLVKTMYIPL